LIVRIRFPGKAAAKPPAVPKAKKADVVEHLEVFDHVGLLFD
jgi:hypothetical protein